MPHTAHSVSAAPVTLKGLACFLIQLCVKFTVFGVTATAFLVWCVPSVSLLVAIDVALGSPKRAGPRIASSDGALPDEHATDNAHSLQYQPMFVLQADVKGSGAAAA